MNLADADNEKIVKSIFMKYDADSSGDVDVTELQALCYDLGYYMKKSEVEIAIKFLDKNNDGAVDFGEFFAWWKNNDKFRHLEPEKMLRMTHAVAMFRKYDVDGDGTIDVSEYAKLCEDMGHKQNARQLEEGLAKLDANKDGVINFDEFCDWLGWF